MCMHVVYILHTYFTEIFILRMLLKIFFTVMKWFLCFPKSQSKIEMDRWWSDFTLTFWRNEKVNHLVKIILWYKQCVHLAYILHRDIYPVNGVMLLQIMCNNCVSMLYIHLAYILLEYIAEIYHCDDVSNTWFADVSSVYIMCIQCVIKLCTSLHDYITELSISIYLYIYISL